MDTDYYFQQNPVALMELNLSPVVEAIGALPAQRFADVMEAINTEVIPQAVLLDQGLLVRSNAAMLSLLKAESEEELALRFGDAMGPETFPSMIAAVLALRGGEHQYRFETTNTRLDGITVQLRLLMRRSPEDDSLATGAGIRNGYLPGPYPA